MKPRPMPTFDVYYAPDGVLVVHVETDGIPEDSNGPIMRLYINDGPAEYENPPIPAGLYLSRPIEVARPSRKRGLAK